MASLEIRRSLLEDLEIIENAIASRLGRNPELYYDYLKKQAEISNESLDQSVLSASVVNRIHKRKKLRRNRKQMILQQHEIDIFLKESLQKLKKLSALKGPVNTDELKDEDANFITFKRHLDEINKKHVDDDSSLPLDIVEKDLQYAMFSASDTDMNPSTILSQKARGLLENHIFKKAEQFGECMELESLHAGWFEVVKGTECTLLQFFNILEKFLDDKKYLLDPPMDRKNDRYLDFLEKVSNYLETFFNKSYNLINSNLLERKIRNDFEKYSASSIEQVPKGFYCPVCAKWFKTVNVFEGHLTGKHHLKNVNKRYAGLLSEYKVHRYLRLLEKEFRQTREFIERKLAFTTEERMEEMARLALEYQASDYGPEEKEDDDIKGTQTGTGSDIHKGILGGTFDLPLGPDGLPMPFWLYKLQGLDVTYSCEICANKIYKGRRVFEKHFVEPTHIYHLQCLGIDPTPTFKGITSIQEAQSLWEQMASDHNHTNIAAPGQRIEMDIEVEDEDGNVMTQKLYNELKKQGLV